MSALKLSLLSSLFFTFSLQAQEICNNAIDDDGDGAIDLNDPECICSGTLNDDVPSLIPNCSFEEQWITENGVCCPYGFVTPVSPPWLTCALGWEQPTDGTTDYMHTCGYMPEAVVPLPVPHGEGCVGTIGLPAYKEYVGKSISESAIPAKIPHTLSVWLAATSMSSLGVEGEMLSAGCYYDAPWNVSIFGRTTEITFPITTYDCVGLDPEWIELGTVQVDPVAAWQPVTIAFTSDVDISTVIIGPSCNLGSSFVIRQDSLVTADDTIRYTVNPYLLYDNLILNESSLFTPGITRTGSLCTDDLVLTASEPDGANAGQWYSNGIALIGSTDPVLDLSGATSDGGRYAYTCASPDGCFRSDLQVTIRPAFTFTPNNGGAPLAVTFVATSTNAEVIWDFGDGAQAQGDTVTHVYEEVGSYSVSLSHEVDGCSMTTVVDDAILVQEGTGIAERYGMGRMIIAPDPVEDVLRATPGTGYTQWRVLNALGQVVLQGSVINGNIEHEAALGGGSYVLRAEGDGKIATARFIKR